ncbi:MAG: M3 family metallopeptidase [Candidatus Thorarchaeota archaeon]|jgi:oligoendopeptidase F
MAESEMSWDLSPIVNGASVKQIQKTLGEVVSESKDFAEKYFDKIPSMNSDSIANMLEVLEAISVKAKDVLQYCSLRFAADSTDKEAAQLRDWSMRASSQRQGILMPLDIRLGNLVLSKPELINDDALQNYRHYLERLKAEAPYFLSEDEERMVVAKDVYGIQLISQMRGSWVSEKAFDIDVKGERKTVPFSTLAAMRMDPNRKVREIASATTYKSFHEDRLLHGSALRSICADHMTMTEKRHLPSPMSKSFLDQDVSEQTISTLLSTIEATSNRYQEFLKLKANLMGLDKLAGYDVIAPFSDKPVWKFDWSQAKQIVVDSFDAFDQEMGGIVNDMFISNRVDAANRVGKRYGAFCSYWVAAKSSFVFTSYNGTINDLYTLAHEQGHSVQGHYTMNAHTLLNYRTSSCMAEMGSIWGELLLTEKILSMSETNEQKLETLSHVLSNFFYTVYYVGMRALFEQSVYDSIVDGKLIDADTACGLWSAARDRIFADSVEWSEYMEYEWARIPHHFIPNFRFYNYSYSFAQMLVFALYELFKEKGGEFKAPFKKLLAKGNSMSPQESLAEFGYDISKPSFWELGAKQAGQLLREMKKLI